MTQPEAPNSTPEEIQLVAEQNEGTVSDSTYSTVQDNPDSEHGVEEIRGKLSGPDPQSSGSGKRSTAKKES